METQNVDMARMQEFVFVPDRDPANWSGGVIPPIADQERFFLAARRRIHDDHAAHGACDCPPWVTGHTIAPPAPRLPWQSRMQALLSDENLRAFEWSGVHDLRPNHVGSWLYARAIERARGLAGFDGAVDPRIAARVIWEEGRRDPMVEALANIYRERRVGWCIALIRLRVLMDEILP